MSQCAWFAKLRTGAVYRNINQAITVPTQPCLHTLSRKQVAYNLIRTIHLGKASADDVQPVPDLPAPAAVDLDGDKKWIAGMISTWLDEDWTPLEVHQLLGEAAGAAYVKCRQQGDDDMSSLVLGLSNELLAFNYRETFVNAFEVANKVVEMLMMRGGVDVCCTTDEDAARLARFSNSTMQLDPASEQ